MRNIKKIFALGMVLSLVSCSYNSAEASCSHVWILDSSYSEKPTCIYDGYNWYDCSVCGDYKKEILPATGIHKWSEWEPDGYLCEDGKYTRYCEECYETETKERKGDGSHLWSDWDIWSEPDCLNKGTEYRKCYNCYEYEYRDIPADSSKHAWSNWTAVYGATALKSGTMQRYCYICDMVEEKQTPKLAAQISLSVKKKILKKGKSFTLKISKYTYGDVVSKYTSSNKKVAIVNSKGKVVAKKNGQTKITVTMKSGCKATCTVIVK